MHGVAVYLPYNLAAFAALPLILSFTMWQVDIIVEASLLGYHTPKVQFGINLAFILFILSEIALFGSIFWGYLHSALSPSVQIGSIWPPHIDAVSPFEIPLLGSAVLFTSSLSITVSHYGLIGRDRQLGIYYLIFTICKGIYFTFLQLYEYFISPFTITDSIFGSIFYLATGLHGSHILFGSIMLLVSLLITVAYMNTDRTHTGYKLAIIYWHFVDVLWAFIYALFYLWPAIVLYQVKILISLWDRILVVSSFRIEYFICPYFRGIEYFIGPIGASILAQI